MYCISITSIFKDIYFVQVLIQQLQLNAYNPRIYMLQKASQSQQINAKNGDWELQMFQTASQNILASEQFVWMSGTCKQFITSTSNTTVK